MGVAHVEARRTVGLHEVNELSDIYIGYSKCVLLIALAERKGVGLRDVAEDMGHSKYRGLDQMRVSVGQRVEEYLQSLPDIPATIKEGKSMSSFRMKPTSGGGDYELPPTGTFPAVLVGLIDVGTHVSNYGGETRPRHMVALVWEIDTEDEAGVIKRFVMGQSYTLSLNEKAKLRPIVGAIRGKPLGDDEEYDIAELVGKPCMVEIVHSVGEKVYGNVGLVSALPKQLRAAAPKPRHDLIVWEMGGEAPIPMANWLPRIYGKTIKELILASEEMRGRPISENGDSAGEEEAPF